MKKSFLFIALQAGMLPFSAQTIYSSSFGNMALQSYTTGSSSTFYSNIPSGYNLINDGFQNNPGAAGNPNKPFHVTGLTTTGWAALYNQVENDTFLVSTSWLDTTQISVNRWVITPPISNISVNTVLTWLAKCPDANYRDGYEVYGTNKTGALAPQDFSIGDRLFAIADGNTAGGGENSNWTRRSVALGSFAGQTLRFAFRNNSTDMYQLWIDDIEVINLSNSLDAALGGYTEKKYILTGTNDSVNVNVSNLGAATINNVSLSYQIGNSSVNTENFLFPSGLSYGQGGGVKFALPYSVSQQGFYLLKTWINLVNGQNSQNLSNDTTRSSVTIQNTNPSKAVLFEQFVSANNGEGPDAQEKALALQSGQVIVVNIHDQDSMRVTAVAPLVADYKKNFATAMADRTYFNNSGTVASERSYYDNHVNVCKSSVTPVSLSIINKSFNAATNTVAFTLKADFIGEVRGDYRINAYLTENQVGSYIDSTINGYNQWNNSYNVPWSPYYQKGYYSPVANTYILSYGRYRHQNVLVHSFGGAYGLGAVITSTGGTQGQSYLQSFSLTLPSQSGGIYKFIPDNLYIVGFVAEYSADKNNRRVLNATKDKLTINAEYVGIPELEEIAGLSVYPNPSTGIFYFNYEGMKNSCSISVNDMLGRCMRLVNVGDNLQMTPLDLSELPDGVYFLKIRSGRQSFTEKVVIQKGQN